VIPNENNIPFPAPLKMSGSLAAEWKRFCSDWRNYSIRTHEKTQLFTSLTTKLIRKADECQYDKHKPYSVAVSTFTIAYKFLRDSLAYASAEHFYK